MREYLAKNNYYLGHFDEINIPRNRTMDAEDYNVQMLMLLK